MTLGEWHVEQLPQKTLTEITSHQARREAIDVAIGGSPLDIVGKNFLWLNWGTKTDENYAPGETFCYETYSLDGHKNMVYSDFKDAGKGDLTVGYTLAPKMRVSSIWEVAKARHVQEGREVITFRKLQNTRIVSRETLKHLVKESGIEMPRSERGSLFKISEEQFRLVLELIEASSERSSAAVEVDVPIEPYSLEGAVKDLFMSKEEFVSILDTIKRKKNVILQGPPGVGKTFIAERLAFASMGEKAKQRVCTIQFHQSYSYEDFIQGYRPGANGNFVRKNGVFYSFCHRAQKDPSNQYFMIIDEINRGNLSKIFGEMLMLIEHDKRDPKYELTLSYAEFEDEKFYVPKNLFLIGTMNTADRSLALVDYALRRRFAFIDIRPSFDSPNFKKLLLDFMDYDLADCIIERLVKLNEQIAGDTKDLGPDYQVGHSYFCPYGDNIIHDKEWYQTVVRQEIKPLLKEYWFDDEQKADVAINALLL